MGNYTEKETLNHLHQSKFEYYMTIGYNLIMFSSERLLCYVPLIHDKKETLVPRQSDDEVQRQAVLFQSCELRFLDTFPHPFSKVKVYQDGLPQMSNEQVAQFLKSLPYSPHNDILRLLKIKGATILGTEDPALLAIVNYSLRIIRQHLMQDGQDPDPISETDAKKHLQRIVALTKPRDLAIASRINTSLEKGDIGILFIGLLHQPLVYLDTDIIVTIPEEFRTLL